MDVLNKRGVPIRVPLVFSRSGGVIAV